MKVSRNKRDMFSVMGHSHFGGVTIEKEGIVMEVPEDQIDKRNGKYKTKIRNVMNRAKTLEGMTVEDAMKLSKAGVSIHQK
jgi:hypothetical protein